MKERISTLMIVEKSYIYLLILTGYGLWPSPEDVYLMTVYISRLKELCHDIY